MEVRRQGARVMHALDRAHGGKKRPFSHGPAPPCGAPRKSDELFSEIGAKVLSTVEGMVSELVDA